MSDNKKIYIWLSVLVLSVIFAYWDVLNWMYIRYMGADSYYSHGFLIPPVALFMVWRQRDVLQKMQAKKSLSGLFIIVAALFLHLFGTTVYIFSVSGFSLYLLIIGLVIFLCGWEITRKVWFPLLFIFLMFPLPLAVINLISFPLKMLAAAAGEEIVYHIGVPVYREGFNIFIPGGKLLVGNPCSGLRSLIAFIALGAIFAYISDLANWKKVVLFLTSVPIALFSNMVRVPVLILASHYLGVEAAAPDTMIHTGSGLMVFVLGFLLMYLTARGLEWLK